MWDHGEGGYRALGSVKERIGCSGAMQIISAIIIATTRPTTVTVKIH
jgi:hypothetical protein